MMFRRHRKPPQAAPPDQERDIATGAFAASQVNTRALVLVDQLLQVAHKLEEVLREERAATGTDADVNEGGK